MEKKVIQGPEYFHSGTIGIESSVIPDENIWDEMDRVRWAIKKGILPDYSNSISYGMTDEEKKLLHEHNVETTKKIVENLSNSFYCEEHDTVLGRLERTHIISTGDKKWNTKVEIMFRDCPKCK